MKSPEILPIHENREEAIKSLEFLNIGLEQRAQLIMVYLKLKPATELSLFPWNTSPQEVEEVLKKVNLHYLKKDSASQSNTTAKYAVSKDKLLAENLLHTSSSESPDEYGRLMGYPETAIQAFLAGDVYKGHLPDDIESSIFKIAFSQEHFEEEFEIIRKWNRALEEYAPNVNEKVKEFKKS